MPVRLLPRIHPFWLTLGYGIFVGYQVRKYDIDKKIMDALHARHDLAVAHDATIVAQAMKDVMHTMITGKPAVLLPDGTSMACSSAQTADLNGTKG